MSRSPGSLVSHCSSLGVINHCSSLLPAPSWPGERALERVSEAAAERAGECTVPAKRVLLQAAQGARHGHY